jgi:hypothetical protein
MDKVKRSSLGRPFMDTVWMRDSTGEFIDIHQRLFSYEETLSFFKTVERESDVHKYCTGNNAGGRWVFQVFNKGFVTELAEVIRTILRAIASREPVVEVMAGDGRLTEFLRPLLNREIVSTDTRDGRYDIAYPKWVQRMDALEAVSHYKPSCVVICWEPYLSMAGINVVKTKTPTVWIGNPERCGHRDLFKTKSIRRGSRYALCCQDSFADHVFRSDIFLFNCRTKWFKP